MKRMPKIKDVMTAFPFSIGASATMSEVKTMMKEHGVGHMPVKLEDDSLSVVSLREIERTSLPGHSHTDFDELTAGDLCPAQIYQVDLHTSVIEVLDEMSERHLDCVLITRHDKLAGIFTFSDACRAYSASLKDQFFPSGGDDIA